MFLYWDARADQSMKCAIQVRKVAQVDIGALRKKNNLSKLQLLRKIEPAMKKQGVPITIHHIEKLESGGKLRQFRMNALLIALSDVFPDQTVSISSVGNRIKQGVSVRTIITAIFFVGSVALITLVFFHENKEFSNNVLAVIGGISGLAVLLTIYEFVIRRGR